LSTLLGLTPVVRLRLENHLLDKSYPPEGFLEGIVDTGYQGFVAVPKPIFASLSMPNLSTSRRRVRLADGSELKSEVGQGSAVLAGLGVEVDGPVETITGLGEVLVGTQFLSRFRIELDYCLRRVSLSPC
jgi:clan AA aspartic protease